MDGQDGDEIPRPLPRPTVGEWARRTVVWIGPTDPRWGQGGPATVLRNESLPCLACHLAEWSRERLPHVEVHQPTGVGG